MKYKPVPHKIAPLEFADQKKRPPKRKPAMKAMLNTFPQCRYDWDARIAGCEVWSRMMFTSETAARRHAERFAEKLGLEIRWSKQ